MLLNESRTDISSTINEQRDSSMKINELDKNAEPSDCRPTKNLSHKTVYAAPGTFGQCRYTVQWFNSVPAYFKVVTAYPARIGQ